VYAIVLASCLLVIKLLHGRANGLRYLRWGGDGEAVQPEKCSGVENCLRLPQNPQRQVHALLGAVELEDSLADYNDNVLSKFDLLLPVPSSFRLISRFFFRFS